MVAVVGDGGLVGGGYISRFMKLNVQLEHIALLNTFLVVFLFFSVQPFSTCRIGSPGPHYTTEVRHDNSVKVEQRKASISPLKALFGGMTKTATPPPTVGVTVLPAGSQDEYWGPPITIHGRVSTVSVFSDVVHSAQFRALNMSGQFHREV